MKPKHKQAIELYKQGLTLKEIGKIVGLSHVSIMQAMKRRGIDRRPRGRKSKYYDQVVEGLKARLSTHEIASRFDIKMATVEACRRTYFDSIKKPQ
jgi:transposase